MKVLCIGCHCDDIELGCGATLYKRRKDWIVDAVVLSNSTFSGTSLTAQCEKALGALSVNSVTFYNFQPSFFEDQQLWEVLVKFIDYDLVITQEPDFHQDHACLHRVTNRLFLGVSVLAYSSSPLSNPDFVPNYFERVDKDAVDAKLVALSAYHDIYEQKPYFNADAIRSSLTMNGLQAGSNYAEGFKVVRMVS